MKRAYKCLSQNEFTNGSYCLTAIRDEDKYAIMKWRNEQIGILRQKDLLTREKQELYFQNVIDKLFEDEKPEQLLFSFLENKILIGYGGLVHIDWDSMNAEVSFITSTERNANEKVFAGDFSNYLSLLFPIAFDILKLVKIHTTFYSIPQRIAYKKILEKFNFQKEGELERHISINRKIENVLIYSCFNKR